MNLLIVDDQSNVIEALSQSINWTEVGITCVYTAVSVQQAKAIIEHQDIHILMTDIEMPIEDGLSLVRWVGAAHSHIPCIVITSHPDFAYAKQAISLNVCEYILQPAKNEEVIAAVQNAMQQIKKRNSHHRYEGEQLFTISERNFAAKRFLENWPRPSDPDFDHTLFRKAERLRDLDVFCRGDDLCYLLLLQIAEWHTIPSDPYSMVFPVKNLINQAAASVHGRSVVHVRPDNTYAALLVVDQYASDMEALLHALQAEIYNRYQCIVNLAYSSSEFPQVRESFDLLLRFLENRGSLPVGITLVEAADIHGEKSENYEQYYEDILSYIDSHLEQNITRAELAAHIHVSSDYLSHIVRITTNDSLKNLITGKKMKYARALLKNSDLPVGEIAVKCGYDSFAYFSKVYRSIYKESPSDTRKNILR